MSNSKIATPYKTNELDMVTFFENEILMKKLKNGGVNFNSRRGRSTKPKNNDKSIGFFTSDLTLDFEMELPVVFLIIFRFWIDSQK